MSRHIYESESAAILAGIDQSFATAVVLLERIAAALERSADALPASDPRAETIAYLRSLPAGGVAEVVAEARVAEWDRHILRGGRDTLHWHIAHVDGTFGVRQHDAMLVGEHATEVAARSWIETAAIADGWTIARTAEGEGR